jgi:hypothetical protein
MKKCLITVLTLLVQTAFVFSQIQSPDSLQKSPNVIGGIYDRPYILRLGGQIAIGGYAEMNSNFVREDGVEEGLSFEARRFNIFIFSAISERVKLTSELEFEHGTEEIALETALVDVQFHTALNLRAGILLSPLGKFNIAHDSPRYDLVDRPLVSTEIIPATLSEVGVGLFGALFPTLYDRISYELYLVNGLGDGVVGGVGDGTRIPMGKSAEAFEEDNNGSPAFTGRLSVNPRFGGEIGFSFHSGFYNSYKFEGEQIDDKRRLTILALDGEYRWRRLKFRGEAALAKIDVPASLSEMFADQQKGFYGEVGYTLLRRPLFNFQDASLTLVSRYDYIDLNDGKFSSTGQSIGDSVRRLTFGASFRPTTETSIRWSYARNWHRDVFNNIAHSMNFQFGVATYF